MPPQDNLPDHSTAAQDAQAKTRRLLADMQALSSRIAAVQEIVTAINQSLELDEILDIVGHQAKWLLDFDSCSVCLVEENSSEPNLITLFGPPVTRQALRGGEQDPIEDALHTNQAQLIREAGETAAFQSYIVLPMGVEGSVLGTINFASKKSQIYNLDDLRIAYLLALQLASAIHNARQFNQIHSLYQELEEAYKNLRSLEEMRDQLINMIAHDLRNPISVMINTLDLMHHIENPDFGKARRERILERARRSGHQTLAMIDDMLMVSKMESGRLQPSLMPFSVADMLLEKEPNYRLQAQREEKVLRLNLADNLPSITADFDLIGRVIDNLVDNAFKYTNNGGEIIIEAEQKGAAVEVRIRDDGEGIKEEFHEIIFNKFTQAVDEKGTPLRQGVGLGLTFCRMVVEAHSGRIWVESSPEVGSTFFFTLPLVS